MRALIKNAWQRGKGSLADASGLLLHTALLFVGLWALFLVFGLVMVSAATPDAQLAARAARLADCFRLPSVLTVILFAGSLSLALWQQMNAVNRGKERL